MMRSDNIRISCPCPDVQCKNMLDDGNCNGTILFLVAEDGRVIPLCVHYLKTIEARSCTTQHSEIEIGECR